MSLGENLQFLRKRENMTQEQLAEALDVSRQSVSKWESDTTYPEMDKLLQMANMFRCTLDELVQQDISTLYVEDKTNYDRQQNTFSKRITAGIGCILFGVTLMAFLSGILPQTENSETFYGMVFFIFVVIAVAIFIVTGLQQYYFEEKNPYIENFYTEEEKEEFHKKYTVWITVGVVLIIVGVILLMGLESMLSGSIIAADPNIDIEAIEGSILLLFVTVAVCMLVYAGLQADKYNIDDYNALHDPNSATYKKSRKKKTACAIIMLIATIVSIMIWVYSKYTGENRIQIDFPNQYIGVTYAVGGILCGIAAIIINKSDSGDKK